MFCKPRALPYTNTINTKPDTELGSWLLAKMEQLLDTERILDPDAYHPLMTFASLLGGDDYFLKQ
jgi:hypothetical protein